MGCQSCPSYGSQANPESWSVYKNAKALSMGLNPETDSMSKIYNIVSARANYNQQTQNNGYFSHIYTQLSKSINQGVEYLSKNISEKLENMESNIRQMMQEMLLQQSKREWILEKELVLTEQDKRLIERRKLAEYRFA